jgi:hypothetical protein
MPRFNIKDADAALSYVKHLITQKQNKAKADEGSRVKIMAMELGLTVNNMTIGNDKIVVHVSGDQDKIDLLNNMVSDRYRATKGA